MCFLKPQIILLFFIIPLSVFSQRIYLDGDKVLKDPLIHTAEKDADEWIYMYPGNWENADEFRLYRTQAEGYVIGTNEYEDLSKAQQFAVEEPFAIHGATFWFAAREGETGSIDINIWDFDTQPGTLLFSQSVPVADIDATNSFSEAFFFEFDPPVVVDGDFAVGFSMEDIGDAAIGMVSSADEQGGGLGMAWEQWYNHNWFSILMAWELDIDLGIVLVGKVAEDDHEEGAIDNVRVSQRTDGSGLVDVVYDVTGALTPSYVFLDVSLDGGTTFTSVNPAWVSGDYWPVSEGADKHLVFDARGAVPGASTSEAMVRLTARTGVIVTTAPATGITPFSVTMGGEVVSDGGQTVTERGLAYGTTPDPAISGNRIVAGSGTGSFTATIEDLDPLTQYYVRAYASTSQGTTYGNQVRFTTQPEGPMVIEGPGGATITIPEAAEGQALGVTLEEHPPLNRQHEQAASVAFRVQMDGNQQIVHAKDDFLISLPVTLKNPNPGNLYFIVRMENGGLAPMPGTYNQETGTYQIKTFGIARDYVFQVVSGPPPTVVTSTGKSLPETEQATGEKIWDWPSLDFVIYDYSDADPRPLSEQAIKDHIKPVANDVLRTLQSSGFAAPMLQQDSLGRYHMILADTLAYSYYEPPYNQLLGRIFIGYPPYITDYSDPSTWRLSNVIMHEAFHAVQQTYDVKFHADNSVYMANQLDTTAFSMNASSAYDEGTASLVGATYERTGSLTSGKIYVDWGVPHDLGHPVDDFIYSSPYDKQDFFAFVAKRFFNSNLVHLDPLYLALGSEISIPLKRSQETSDYLLQLRKDFDYFLRSAGTSLPEAYTEYALQRLYIHDDELLLRDAERYGDVDGFTQNTLSRSLLERSEKHFEWQSARPDTLAYDPLEISSVRPLSSAAVTFHMPEDLQPGNVPDTLFFMVDISGGAQLNQVMQEEGLRLMIIRAMNEDGNPVPQNATIVVDDVSEPVQVPMSGDVSHLVFLVINAYVDEMIAGITLDVVSDEPIFDYAGIGIDLSGPMTTTDGVGVPGGGIAWSNNHIPALTWIGTHFSTSGAYNYLGDVYEISISGRISADGTTVENLHATSMRTSPAVPGSSTYREITIRDFPLLEVNHPYVAGSTIPGTEAEAMVTNVDYQRTYLDDEGELVTVKLVSVDWGDSGTALSVHFMFMHTPP